MSLQRVKINRSTNTRLRVSEEAINESLMILRKNRGDAKSLKKEVDKR